ncbi:MAG: HD domain-containing phosphohydrolase [Candidatus Thiodiazotropha sp.]
MVEKQKKTILIVDDTPENLDVLKDILTPYYSVKVAVNGKLALKITEAHSPDLILLDVMMPDMDGYETCRKLKENSLTASIPVIFVTTMGEVENESTGFDVGAVDYITKPVSAPIVLRRVATHLSLVRVDELDYLARSAIRMLGEAGHYNDTDTGQHIWRMAAYSRALAEAFGWPDDKSEMLELAAPMHDTGKVGIPDEILKAPRKLEPDEWKVMMEHSQIGHDILTMSDNSVFQMAAEIALNHHEKWDGSGYPNGLEGEAIPESARIVAIADVFDALTMKRPYKEPWTISDAMAEIKKSAGNHFDPRLVECFLNLEISILKIKEEWDAREQTNLSAIG